MTPVILQTHNDQILIGHTYEDPTASSILLYNARRILSHDQSCLFNLVSRGPRDRGGCVISKPVSEVAVHDIKLLITLSADQCKALYSATER